MNKEDTNEIDEQRVASLCIEFWKLTKNSGKAVEQLGETEGKRLAAQIKYSEKQLETLANELGLRLVDYDGEEFHAGVAASADNASDFDEEIPLVVTRTLEPAVVKYMRIVRPGRVLVSPNPETKE